VRSRPLAIILVVPVLASAGCGGAPDASSAPSRGEAARTKAERAELVRGAPPMLARLYAQGDALLPGGARAFRARLRELDGVPIVVNKWASWCGPCRKELPFFRRQALERGRRVAFLGANTNDSPGPARRFLDGMPLPYPSYEDQNGDVAQVFNGTIAFPTTAFYDRRGHLATLKQGVYTSERELATDIERYGR
jgi:cytochrome c biogenesis protein CcmG/thiol:disulfide interchange protein DsbE